MDNEKTLSMLTDHYAEVNAELSRVAREKPYALLGGAAAVGFIWGGGLRASFVGSLISLGSRTLLSHVAGAWFATNFPVTAGKADVHH